MKLSLSAVTASSAKKIHRITIKNDMSNRTSDISFPILALLRFLLAVAVVLYHLRIGVFPQSGTIAVLGFFLISGFLVTLISRTVYSNSRFLFFKNRFLRIAPTYYASLMIGIAAIAIYGESLTSKINVFHVMPDTITLWLKNIFIALRLSDSARIVPQAWSLTIELIWYVILGGFLARFPKAIAVATIISIILPILIFLNIIPLQFYGSAVGSAFAFLIGAYLALLFERGRLDSFPHKTCFFALGVYFCFMFIIPLFKFSIINLYLSVFFLAAAFPIFLVKTSGKYDNLFKFLGNISYPLFLIHWYAADITLAHTGFSKNTTGHLLIALPIAIFMSILIYLLVEKPFQHVRSKNRKRAQGLNHSASSQNEGKEAT